MTDERDVDDPALAAAWRTHSAETPLPALDDAILAAAHRAVKSAPEKISPGREATRPWRWWAPLAAAATIGAIAIGVLQLMPHEHDDTAAVVSDMPANAPAPVDAIKDQKTEDRRDKVIAPVSPTSELVRSPLAPQPFPARKDAAPAKPAAPRAESAYPASPSVLDRADVAGKVAAPAQSAPRPATQSAQESSRVAPMESASKRTLGAAASVSAPSRPDEWIARIRALMIAGDMAEANRALAAFRNAYLDADALLPADLRPWAATVPR